MRQLSCYEYRKMWGVGERIRSADGELTAAAQPQDSARQTRYNTSSSHIATSSARNKRGQSGRHDRFKRCARLVVVGCAPKCRRLAARDRTSGHLMTIASVSAVAQLYPALAPPYQVLSPQPLTINHNVRRLDLKHATIDIHHSRQHQSSEC